MEEQTNECLSQRQFGFVKIIWEIENCFCEAYKKKWNILSPEFSVNGFPSIKWKFNLKAFSVENEAEYVASLHLERLETGDITDPVRVFWNLSCSFEEENITICEKEGVFEEYGSISSAIKNFSKLQKKLQDIATRKFNIKAQFLITSKKDNVAYGRSNDAGLKNLSQNLGVLYTLKDYNDLKINTGKTSVKGHKSILSAVNELLNDIIHQYRGSNEIFLTYSDEISAGKILNYLYTGNLDYVLRMPSISINEAINYFGVKELEEYYMKDELILRTIYNGSNFYYKWVITDIKSKSDEQMSFFSPKFGDRGLNTTFRLHLTEVGMPSDRMGIFIERSVPQQWQELYVTFEIIKIFDDEINLKKTVRLSLRDDGPLGIDDFVPKYILEEPSVTANDTLSILCSIFVPADSISFSVVSNRSCFLSNINAEEHYTLLSKRIESLLYTGKHSDLTVKCRNLSFRVHKCILSARSKVLGDIISRLEEGETVISFSDIDPDIMKFVLRYVYSGVLKEYKTSDVHKIYATAAEFSVLSLKNQCTEILEGNLDKSNVFDYLFLAYTHKDSKLKLAAFNYLINNRSQNRNQGMREHFRDEREIYEEFREYVRLHIQRNPQEGLNIDDF